MSQYSILMGSFIRNGDYPIEANYIFRSEEELKEFYQDPINATLLHEGWFKVVANENEQSLWWVVVDPEEGPYFEKLISASTIEDLYKEIEERYEEIIDKIKELEDKHDEELAHLERKLNKAIIELKEKHNSEIAAIVGSDEPVLKYLPTLDYSNLTAISEAITNVLQKIQDIYGEPLPSPQFRTLRGIEDALVALSTFTKTREDSLQEELNQTQLGVGLNGDGTFDTVNISNTNYIKDSKSVVEALKLLDKEISDLVVDAFIQDAYYDPDTEDIVLTFNTKDEGVKVIRIDVSGALREWEPDNTHPTKVVEITREEVYGGGADKVSADVRIAVDKHNILEKRDNTLIVRGTADNIIYDGDVTVKSKLDSLTNSSSNWGDSISDLDKKLQDEINRAKNSEQELQNNITLLKTEVNNADSELLNKIELEVVRATTAEQVLNSTIETVQNTIENNINVKISSLQDTLNQEISRSVQEDSDIREEIANLKLADITLQNNIDIEVQRAINAETAISNIVDNHTETINNHETRIQKLELDSVNQNTNITNLESLINLKELELKQIIANTEDKLEDDLNDHIHDYNNPHKVTAEQIGLGKVDNTSDLEKPISVAVQNALNEINISLSEKASHDDFLKHITDFNNPHNVTKDQIGLGNVDNTSDLEKPISTATQLALDKKSDIWHTHTMADISDLENPPLFKDFIESVLDLPEDPANGDRYILVSKTESSNARYVLYEYDSFYGQWKQKIVSTGMVASNIDKDVYKFNSSGPERILDASDYVYFYNKIYDETKDLIEDIDWEENDETNDTNNQIRLKITYKTAYGDPNESEATNPYTQKNVKYIDIDKARFLANAYSRPAIQSDIDDGYATSLGEPLLILVMTTGDHVTISLKDALNIYDPVDTQSIDMSVSDWTGNPDTSYKVSANIRLAESQDAISMHVLDDGVFSLLHTTNTNSITLTPNHGTTGSQKSLKADLNINNSLNNNSDILLTVDSSGLSAKIIWGEYE